MAAAVLAAAPGPAAARGQGQAATPPQAAPIERVDRQLDAAASEMGRALFLRCFCAENNLHFDAQGQPQAAVKLVDWTLAGINVQKVERRPADNGSPAAIELEGVRVAIRYATDRHEFDRHPQNDEKMRVTVEDSGNPAQFEQALRRIFAQGLDRPLQLAMPDFWQHFFDPQLPWPPDELNGQTTYNAGATVTGPQLAGNQVVQPPTPTHRAEADSTGPATHDRVQGTVVLRAVVDADGVPRRIVVAQPLGYGLDARAVEAARKWRFAPGTLAGKPVATNLLLREEFVVMNLPR